MDQISTESQVWDLHIHTNKCPKSTGDFNKLSTTEYIDLITNYFSQYPDIKMISFTDHNQISKEVYDEFNARDTGVTLIPGVEIDVEFEENLDPKHLLVYFDALTKNLDTIICKVNKILDDNNVTDKNPIKIDKLLKELADSKLKFLISPHAFKQNKRGINHEWVGGDSNDKSKKYVNQFFVFWEASGLKEIENAKDFLDEFYKYSRMSIVNFSDSSSSQEFERYHNNPPIYFNSLSSYKGLQLVGSDSRRIVFEPEKIDNLSKIKLIGSISFDGIDIKLSHKLNTIIGGRGSGKSILLDSIAKQLGKRNQRDYKDRNKYIDRFNIELYDMNGKPISDLFKVEYFDQSYVSKIFNTENRNIELEKYFEEEFSSIPDIDADIKMASIKEQFYDWLDEDKKISSKANFSDLLETLILIDNDTIKLNFRKQDIPKIDIIDNLNWDEQKKELNKSKIIPKKIKDRPNIKQAIRDFRQTILNEIYNYNKEIIDRNVINYSIMSQYFDFKDNLSSEAENKRVTKDLISTSLSNSFNEYRNRIAIVNALLKLNEYKFRYENKQPKEIVSVDGYEFKKELKIETPIEYFVRIFDEYVSSKSYKQKICLDNIEHMMITYCSDVKNYLNSSKTIEDMDNALRDLKLNYNEKNKIVYKESDIESESPGTQTNILMEYIIKSNSSIPLLIDQPEDNIDNKTIFNDITEWFSKLKNSRQVILVTHDANIVINSDTENLIEAQQESTNTFKYSYGALEYSDNLTIASTILDGGTEAVKKRLNKYGEDYILEGGDQK